MAVRVIDELGRDGLGLEVAHEEALDLRSLRLLVVEEELLVEGGMIFAAARAWWLEGCRG